MSMAESGWGSYRRGWRTAVVVLVALGLVTAFVFVGLSTIVIAFLMGGTLVASIHLSIGLAQERPPAELVRVVLRSAVQAGVCVVAVAGFLAAIGSATVWLAVLLAITSPPVISWFWPQLAERVRRPASPQPPRIEQLNEEPEGDLREQPRPDLHLRKEEPTPEQESREETKPERAGRKQSKHDRERKAGDRERKAGDRERKAGRSSRKHSKPEPPPLQEPIAPKTPEPVDLSGLTDEDLCLAWRRSFTELQSCTTDEQRLIVIANRHAYLDELERRAPDAFSQWLDSGARAAGNPAKFFSPRTNHGDPD
ncbi:hypothetical protein [Kribbella sp. CA-247076]|uniref:hypothetical protein n=1 Tax=Kribbella sp. CA-247076 TaxID=3239941 RepID=UPI003D906BAE